MKKLFFVVTSMLALNAVALTAQAQDCRDTGRGRNRCMPPRRQPQPQPVRVGTNVIDENNYEGSISEIYREGTARVAYPQYDGWGRVYKTDYHVKDLRDLVPSVNRVGQFEDGAKVIDENNYQGSIARIYADGRTRVGYPQYDAYRRIIKTDYHLKFVRNLSREVQQLRGFRTGDHIVDENNYHGTIDNLYADGRVQVAYPQYSNGQHYKTDYHLKNVLQLRKIYSTER